MGALISGAGRGKSDLIIGAELIIAEYVFGGQKLISAIGIAVRRILETIGVMPAGPAIIVAHVGAQTGLVLDGNLLDSGMQRHFAVVCIDVGAMAIGIEQIAVCFTVGAYAGTDSRRFPDHAHRITGRRYHVHFDILFAGLEIFLLHLFGDAALIGNSEAGRTCTAAEPVSR